MKKALYIIIAIAILVIGFFAATAYFSKEKKVEIPVVVVPEGQEALVGTVTEVDLEGMMVDGPGLITIDTEAGTSRVIAVPSFGRNMCNENAEIADVGLIKVGDKVEVQGEVGEENYIIPCMGAEHYLRVTASVSGKFLVKGVTWVWEKTEMNDGTVTTPKKAGMYSILFNANGTLTGKTSCNGFGGDYEFGSDGFVSFGPFMSTQMYCEGSQETEFSQAVTNSNQYAINSEGKLVLTMKDGSGKVILKKQ